MSIRIGLIGAGGIARKHLDVIRDIEGIEAVGITSRTKSKAEDLSQEYNIPVVSDDIDSLLKDARPDALMVLVSFEQMFNVSKQVIPLGLPVFLEKPPGLNPGETKILVDLAKEHSVNTMVGYNRRFYSNFYKGMDIIKKHGDLMGIRVEGHERFWKLVGTLKDEVRADWIYANNTHMIDLLRLFGGEPVSVSAYSCQKNEKNGDQFSAAMKMDSGALGNFIAHWYSPGGWGVTLFGEGVTVEFKPLEAGSWICEDFKAHDIELDEIDIKYKAGFFKQMEAFREMVNTKKLAHPGMDLESAYKTMLLAQTIAGREK